MTTKETRPETERRVRQLRPDTSAVSGLKLAVNEEALDRKQYVYRWVNDKDGRVRALSRENVAGGDWEVAPEPAALANKGVGTVQSVPAGAIAGKPYDAVLMRKPREWHEEDQRVRQKRADDNDADLRRGHGHEKEAPELRGDVAYTPGSGNSIR